MYKCMHVHAAIATLYIELVTRYVAISDFLVTFLVQKPCMAWLLSTQIDTNGEKDLWCSSTVWIYYTINMHRSKGLVRTVQLLHKT